MSRYLSLIIITALGLMASLTGCTKKYHLQRDDLTVETPWPYHHGRADSRGLAVPAKFSGELTELWAKRVPGKPAGPLTIHHNALLYPSTRKKIRVYSLSDGEFRGKIKTKGPVQSGVTVADSIAFFAVSPRKSHLRAVNMLSGKTVWKRPIKDVCQGSIIVNNVLIVSSTDGQVQGLDIISGDQVWTYQADQRLAAPPVVSGDTVFQVGDHGRLYLLSASDGRELSRLDIEGTLVAPVVVGRAVYATDLSGSVFALDVVTGTTIWRSDLDGPLWTTGALGENQLVVAHSGGEVIALDLIDGTTRWKVDLGQTIKASPIIVGQYVVVGTAAGRVKALDLASGQEVSRIDLKGSIDYSPVTDGRRVYVATDKGRIVCLGEQDENAKAEH